MIAFAFGFAAAVLLVGVFIRQCPDLADKAVALIRK